MGPLYLQFSWLLMNITMILKTPMFVGIWGPHNYGDICKNSSLELHCQAAWFNHGAFRIRFDIVEWGFHDRTVIPLISTYFQGWTSINLNDPSYWMMWTTGFLHVFCHVEMAKTHGVFSRKQPGWSWTKIGIEVCPGHVWIPMGWPYTISIPCHH